jgi:hypothetical protein
MDARCGQLYTKVRLEPIDIGSSGALKLSSVSARRGPCLAWRQRWLAGQIAHRGSERPQFYKLRIQNYQRSRLSDLRGTFLLRRLCNYLSCTKLPDSFLIIFRKFLTALSLFLRNSFTSAMSSSAMQEILDIPQDFFKWASFFPSSSVYQDADQLSFPSRDGNNFIK